MPIKIIIWQYYNTVPWKYWNTKRSHLWEWRS